MKQIGTMDIIFDEYKDGIYYFDLIVEVAGVTRHTKLPRYHAMVGWVEVFGLPPQHEWVILEDVVPFSKEASLIVDGHTYTETFAYTSNKEDKTHTIVTERSDATSHEKLIWVESYKGAPQVIQHTMTFEHGAGTYICNAEKSLVTKAQLTDEALDFVTKTFSEHGQTEHVWKKSFSAQGVLPEIYYGLFPAIEGIDLSNIQGSVVEVGYMAGERGTDGVHGDWYKRFQLGDQVLYIVEEGYTSQIIETDNGPKNIKSTYHKKLYR